MLAKSVQGLCPGSAPAGSLAAPIPRRAWYRSMARPMLAPIHASLRRARHRPVSSDLRAATLGQDRLCSAAWNQTAL